MVQRKPRTVPLGQGESAQRRDALAEHGGTPLTKPKRELAEPDQYDDADEGGALAEQRPPSDS
jgi:hypothetical protein